MISHNTLLYDLLDRKFSMDLDGENYVVNYTEGDLYELAAKLTDHQTYNLGKYPIIWLQSGYTVQRDHNKRKTKLIGCRFFFITSSELNKRYKQRYESNYNDFLYKILLKFDKVINDRTGINSDIVDSFRSFPLNKVAEILGGDDQKTPLYDIWDALELSTDIEITDGCFPEFIIKI